METHLASFLKDTPDGDVAERILRTCTHCGFCLATCPTYQEAGSELDSPRGRIYLMKQMLEGNATTEKTQVHLDCCLTCLSCETTCPSGVEYGRLVDIGRKVIETRVPPRSLKTRMVRWLLRKVLPRRRLFAGLLRVGRGVRPLLPASLRDKIPTAMATVPAWPATRQRRRRVLLPEGCVQPSLAPVLDPHTARLLDGIGIDVIRTPRSGCCGAISQHLGKPEEAASQIRRNIDAWWPQVQDGVEAIVCNASGCGAQIREYGHLMANVPGYADKAERIARLAVDPVELLEQNVHHLRRASGSPTRIAFQTPCTMQHALGLGGRVDRLLEALGFELTQVPEPHICCGSAGTYSVLQPDMSKRLRQRKLANLSRGMPELIATSNIGCLTHLAGASDIPVRHWVELVDSAPTDS